MRYAIYDSETGELLENAQGYGYKSKDKALRGWKFLKAKHFKTTKEKEVKTSNEQNKKCRTDSAVSHHRWR